MEERKFKTVEVEEAMAGVTAIWYLPRNRVLYFYDGMSKKSNYEKKMIRERKRKCSGAFSAEIFLDSGNRTLTIGLRFKDKRLFCIENGHESSVIVSKP
ncbi:MAG: hypothetical protein U5J82_12130 [Desulfobacterales bacterium]|nr:hypothetical protein [Desulfobacterales bacterium]